MRTNVVSCDSAAVTLLLGVLHVPQLYSLWDLHGVFPGKDGEKGTSASRREMDGRRRETSRRQKKKKNKRGERSVR